VNSRLCSGCRHRTSPYRPVCSPRQEALVNAMRCLMGICAASNRDGFDLVAQLHANGASHREQRRSDASLIWRRKTPELSFSIATARSQMSAVVHNLRKNQFYYRLDQQLVIERAALPLVKYRPGFPRGVNAPNSPKTIDDCYRILSSFHSQGR